MQERWELMKRLIKNKTPVVFQVGANHGVEVRAFRRLWPQLTVYCFEPRAKAFEFLKTEYGADARVHLINKAVYKTEGVEPFYISFKRGGSSLLERNVDSKHFSILKRMVRTIEVPTVTLDVFCEREGIKRIDLLFMDIQGAELYALQGGAGLLERRAVDVLYLEVFFIDLYKNCPQFTDIGHLLESYGYRFRRFFNFGKAKGKPPTMWADAVFVKGD